jgi:diamine N-acetyltransferase
LVIDHIRTLPGVKEFFTSYVPGEGDPSPFYKKMGFKETGEWDDDEKVMKLVL